MPKKKTRIRKPIVVIIRDPDYENEIHTFGMATVHDIDVGRFDLEDEEEAREWAETHMLSALRFAYAGYQDVADLIENVVSNYVGDEIMQEAVKAAKEIIEKERSNA